MLKIMKNKLTILILLIFSIFSCMKIYNNFKVKKEEYVKIENFQKINDEVFTLEEKEEEKQEFVLTKSYLGYIEISRLGIKKLIKYGTSDDILNQNVVGLHKMSVSLDSKVGNIILAGHNNKYVFHKLFKIKLKDKVIITSHNKSYTFIVNKIDIISDDDFSYFKEYDDKKVLTLITCYGKDKRFIVFLEVIN